MFLIGLSSKVLPSYYNQISLRFRVSNHCEEVRPLVRQLKSTGKIKLMRVVHFVSKSGKCGRQELTIKGRYYMVLRTLAATSALHCNHNEPSSSEFTIPNPGERKFRSFAAEIPSSRDCSLRKKARQCCRAVSEHL